MLSENPTLAEVLKALKDGMTIVEISKHLNMKATMIETKLENAAIINDSKKGAWCYIGGNAEESLKRPIKGKVVRLKIDLPYLPIKEDVKVAKGNDEIDWEYQLFEDCQTYKWEDLKAKKSFNLNQELFNEIKQLSVEKSIKINVLINNLLKKGLAHYIR